VGLPLYSCDGKKLGQVIEVVTVAGQSAVRAEMGTFLGLGSNPNPHPGRNGGAKARPRRNHQDGIGGQNVRDTAERSESEALSLISLSANSREEARVRAYCKHGARIFIAAAMKQADGKLQAARINVGRRVNPLM
jgi:hypothetical protein